MSVDLPRRLPASIETTAYFVCAEALTNAAKHSQARGVDVEVRLDGTLLLLSISDDGTGGADPDRGSGLAGLGDRLAAVADVRALIAALHDVLAGGTVVDPEVVRQLLARRRGPLERLTVRERETLALMAEGHSNAAIARELVVTEATVGKHIRNLFDKLDLPPTLDHHRRVLAVITYLEGGGSG